MRKLLIFIVGFILLLWSCEKEQEMEDKMSYIQDNNWLIAAYTIDGTNAMDSIEKYYTNKAMAFYKMVGSNTTFIITNSDTSVLGIDNLSFKDNNIERCHLIMFSPYLDLKKSTTQNYSEYIHNLNYLLPPYRGYYWDIVSLEENSFTLSCYYEEKRIVFTLKNN